MYHAIKEKGPTIGNGSRGEPSADFFREEYEMNYLLAHSPIPQVPLPPLLSSTASPHRSPSGMESSWAVAWVSQFLGNSASPLRKLYSQCPRPPLVSFLTWVAVAGSLTSPGDSGPTSVISCHCDRSPLLIPPSLPSSLVALTGCKLKAADLLYSGIATHYLSRFIHPHPPPPLH